jgi:formylglycine-generating enzyme required for sulfatase activity
VVRLPSEAEWEYACRAGTETTYYFGNDAGLLDEYGWFRGNSGMVSQPVGQFPPNAWGLHDLHGGIDEFAQDNWHETHADAPADGRGRVTGGDASLRALRGGSWYDLAEHCESAHRNYYAYDIPSEDHGLRVLVEIE